MTPNDLEQIRYLPSIRTRQAELRGYRELRDDTKDELVPIFSLGKLGRVNQVDDVAGRVVEAAVGEYFLDVNCNANQRCEDWARMFDSANAFSTWRSFVAEQEGAVPVALIPRDRSLRAFVRQVLAIEQDHQVVHIRTRNPTADRRLLQSAVAAVDDVDNLLITLDFGYIRSSVEATELEAEQIINELRELDAAVRVCFMASSFPRAVSAFGEEGGVLEILERAVHENLGGDNVAIYGDHASIYPDPYTAEMTRFVPRIDYATPNSWIFRRHRVNTARADNGGWPQCAREILDLPDWDEDFQEDVWGPQIIAEQAASTEPLAGFGSPANWIAVRVNTHIERQLEYGTSAIDDDDDYE